MHVWGTEADISQPRRLVFPAIVRVFGDFIIAQVIGFGFARFRDVGPVDRKRNAGRHGDLYFIVFGSHGNQVADTGVMQLMVGKQGIVPVDGMA